VDEFMGPAELIVTVGGILLIAFLAWFFFGPKKARQAEVRGGVQEIKITVKGGYSPDVIRVREGVPLRLVFDRQEASDCSSRVVFPDFQVSKTLPAFGTTTLEFTPNKSGQFGFACGMNMLHGTLIVEKDGTGEVATGETIPQSNGHQEYAQAVGVGPGLQVAKPAQVEFAIFAGGVTCPTCVVNIEAYLKDLAGVDEVHVNFAAERVTVQYDPSRVTVEEMQRAIQEAGYPAQLRGEPGGIETEDFRGSRPPSRAARPDPATGCRRGPRHPGSICHDGARVLRRDMAAGDST
jgi:Cu+-exporting ATPase